MSTVTEAEIDDDRIFARLNRETDGSLLNNDGVRLNPAGKTAMGNAAYRIGYGRGTAGSVVVHEEDDEIIALHHIEIDKTRQGAGIDELVVKAILATAEGSIRIVDIKNERDDQEDAHGFWNSMGTRWVGCTDDTAQMQDACREGKQAEDYHYRRGDDPELAPLIQKLHQESQARDRLRELAAESEERNKSAPSTDGIEVEEVSDEEAGDFPFMDQFTR